jgi:hypothetical protein
MAADLSLRMTVVLQVSLRRSCAMCYDMRLTFPSTAGPSTIFLPTSFLCQLLMVVGVVGGVVCDTVHLGYAAYILKSAAT